MTPPDYEYLRKFLKDNSGLDLSSDKQYLIESRLLPVARKAGLPGIGELVQKMKGGSSPIANCATKYAPWHVIPSDHKWFRNYAVSEVIIRTLKSLHMKYPEASTMVRSPQNNES